MLDSMDTYEKEIKEDRITFGVNVWYNDKNGRGETPLQIEV